MKVGWLLSDFCVGFPNTVFVAPLQASLPGAVLQALFGSSFFSSRRSNHLPSPKSSFGTVYSVQVG